MGLRELRIHGVGGSPRQELLSADSLDETQVVAEGRGTVFRARRSDPSVEGYEWGRLTSGSPVQPLWVLLLPFTLVNVAGWAHAGPAASGRRRRAVQALVHGSAALLTASYVVWAAIIVVDHLGYRWFGHQVWSAGVPGDGRVFGTVLGLVLTVAALGALVLISRSSQASFESVEPDPSVLGEEHRSARWRQDEDLSSRSFFSHRGSARRLLGRHAAVMGVTLVGVVVTALSQWGGPDLGLGRLFVVLGVLQMVLIVGLGGLCWSTSGRKDGPGSPPALPAVAVTLAVALTNGTFCGITLLVSQVLPDAPGQWGAELALVESFVITLGLWLLTLVLWLLFWSLGGEADELPARTSPPAAVLDGVDDSFRARIARMRGLASGARAAPWLMGIFAVLFLISSAAAVVLGLSPTGPARQWLQPPSSGILLSIATWLLPGLVLATMALMWLSAVSRKLRRGVGIVWDVLTFWPRRFHPLAVRPYTERAVPEFQARVRRHADNDDGLLISAHSQGSVIACAALLPLADQHLSRVALLSHGSPVTTLYAQIFPAYFGQRTVEMLQDRLARGGGRWVNLYRLTDPIGGAVIGSGESGVDVEVSDPAVSVGPHPAEALEPVRPAWTELYGHACYRREQAYQEAAAQLRSELRR